MDEDAALGLGGHHEEHAEEVGGEAGPRGVGDGEDGAVDEILDEVVFLARDEEIIVPFLDADAEAAEGGGDNAEMGYAGVLDGDFGTGHGGEADVTADFNHVGETVVRGPVQGWNALDGEEVGGNAGDAGPHGVEELAELLNVGLAGSIVDGGNAPGEDSRHDDVGRAGNGRLIKEHVGPP